MDKAVIYIEKNGVAVKTIYPSGQKFEFECEINADYVFKFEKPGYITKKIAINSYVAKDRAEEGFDPYRFNVYLFPQVDGVNTVIFNQPVGKIMYKPDLDDIGFDTDYTKSIEAEMKEFEANYLAKEKESPPITPVAAQANADPKPPVVEPKTIPQTMGDPLPPKQETKVVNPEPPKPINPNQTDLVLPATQLNPVIELEQPKKLNPQVEEEKPKKISSALAEEKPKKAAQVAVEQEYKKYSTGTEDAENRKALLAAEEEDRKRRMMASMSQDEQRRNAIAARIETEKRNQYPQPPRFSYQRTENYIKEPNREIAEIILTSELSVVVYRKVQTNFGAVFYFKNNVTVCKWIYDNAYSTKIGG